MTTTTEQAVDLNLSIIETTITAMEQRPMTEEQWRRLARLVERAESLARARARGVRTYVRS